jgi:hypothetical protein
MGQSLSSQAVTATTNVRNGIIQHRISPDTIVEAITSLRNEIAALREDRAQEKEVILDLQRRMNTFTQNEGNGRTFTIFAKFPPELRNKVWKYTLGVPRVVPAMLCFPNDSSIETLIPTTPTHPLLRTSQESRLQALEVLCCYTKDYPIAPKLFLNPHRYIMGHQL